MDGMRAVFTSPLGRVSWFPGHMARASRLMARDLAAADAVVEVRDARAPLATAHSSAAGAAAATKTRVVVLNKADLAPHNLRRAAAAAVRAADPRVSAVVFATANAPNPKSAEAVVEAVQEALGGRRQDSPSVGTKGRDRRGGRKSANRSLAKGKRSDALRLRRVVAAPGAAVAGGGLRGPEQGGSGIKESGAIASDGTNEAEEWKAEAGMKARAETDNGDASRFLRSSDRPVTMMITGVPNVGKSTLINALRVAGKQTASAKVGKKPGLTRHLQWYRVGEAPPVMLLDTPGVMLPRVDDDEAGLKLALVGCIRDGIVPHHVLADYLLFVLNKRGRWGEYVSRFRLEAPTDNIDDLLEGIARSLHLTLPGKRPDLHRAAHLFVDRFRRGDYGPVALDEFGSTGGERKI